MATPPLHTAPGRVEPRSRSAMPLVPAPRTAPLELPRPATLPAEDHLEVPRRDGPAADELSAVAWIVREVTHVPGVLRLRRDQLSFVSTRGVLFEGSAAELGLEVGRSARAGLRVTVGAERLRVHVVRPAGGVAPCTELVERVAGGAPSTHGDATSWHPWRARLAPHAVPVNRPLRGARVRRAMAVFAPAG